MASIRTEMPNYPVELHIAVHDMADGRFVSDAMAGSDAEEFVLHFSFSGRHANSRLHEAFGARLERAGWTWITPRRDAWEVDLDRARAEFNTILKAGWVAGRVNIEPEVTEDLIPTLGWPSYRTKIALRFIRKEILVQQQHRIFLSHKGANKPLVSRFYDLLRELGFAPWLDTEDMFAGDTVHRGLHEGMQSSCAAVFFITPEFRDEKYLRREIDLAMQEHTARIDRFRIISLALANQNGERGQVPSILQPFVYKEPDSELQALRDILRGLPLVVGPIATRR